MFYHRKNLGWTSVFLARDDLPRAHWDAPEFRKMLKRDCERRHPCWTPSVVRNQSPVLLLNRTAFWALSYKFSMTRMMLALMLYFLIVAHKDSCHTLSWSLWRHGRYSDDSACISRRGSRYWIFVLRCSFRLWHQLALLQWSILWLETVYDDFQHDLTRMADKADGSVVLAQLQVAFLLWMW